MANRHDPTATETVDCYNRIKRAGNSSAGRAWRVWHDIEQCPVCGRRKDVLRNPNRGAVFLCDGERIRRVHQAGAPLPEA